MTFYVTFAKLSYTERLAKGIINSVVRHSIISLVKASTRHLALEYTIIDTNQSNECLKEEFPMKKVCLILLLVLVCSGLVVAQLEPKKRPLPSDYGNVVMNNYSEKAGLSPVVFDHWLHRARFTCRLCHVDIAFAMKRTAQSRHRQHERVLLRDLP